MNLLQLAVLSVFLLGGCRPATRTPLPPATDAGERSGAPAVPLRLARDEVGATTRAEFENRHRATKDGVDWPVWSDGKGELAEEFGLREFSDADKATVYACLVRFEKSSGYQPTEAVVQTAYFRFRDGVLDMVDVSFDAAAFEKHKATFTDRFGVPFLSGKDGLSWHPANGNIEVTRGPESSSILIQAVPKDP